MKVWIVTQYDSGSVETSTVAVVDSEDKAKEVKSPLGWPVDYGWWEVE